MTKNDRLCRLSVAQRNADIHTNHWGVGKLRSASATRLKAETDSGS